ncbi:MAG: hypothetical protein GH150_04755 [Hadesarchaea archaeon]|nr:hypothetical protein [Hadesarchaea archaeon]
MQLELTRMAYYCMKYLRRLTRREVDAHGCFRVRKGRRKGKRCLKLVVTPSS